MLHTSSTLPRCPSFAPPSSRVDRAWAALLQGLLGDSALPKGKANPKEGDLWERGPTRAARDGKEERRKEKKSGEPPPSVVTAGLPRDSAPQGESQPT